MLKPEEQNDEAQFTQEQVEMLDSLEIVLAAALEYSEGKVSFIRALRQGGFFEPKEKVN